MRLFLWISFLAGIVPVWQDAHAEPVNWYCPSGQTNLANGGGAMNAGFQFQLGVFTGGFVPTASNIGEWQSHWAVAQTAGYSASNKSFNENFEVLSNAAPFTIGAKAYVWGKSAGATGDEWILFRGSNWTWPSAAGDPMNLPSNFWDASAANEVVLGSVNASGTPWLMKSETVVSYQQWRDGVLTGVPADGAGDDPDHDGTKNLMEFVFGTSPTAANGPPAVPLSLVDVSGQRYLQISLPRLRSRLAAITVEVSSDLATWNSGAAYTTEISNTADTLVIRDKTAGGAGVKRFMRMKAVLQP